MLFKAYLESVQSFKDKYTPVQPVSDMAMMNVFRLASAYDDDEAPILNEQGEHQNKLVCKFPFQRTRKHFGSKLNTYV